MEQIILVQDMKNKESKELIRKMKLISEKYKQTGVNKDNIFKLVSTLMLEANKLKSLKGSQKKDLVIDLIYNLIEQIDDGDEDTEFEMILKSMVPTAIDSFSLMLKVNNTKCCF